MKFSGVVSSLAIAAAVTEAAPAAGKPVQYAVGYDALKAPTPPLIATGKPTAPIPRGFKGLNYGTGPLTTQWSLVALGKELLPTITPASAPNVLVTTAVSAGTRAARIERSRETDQWDVKSLSFACAIDNLGESVPVACSVLFDITDGSLGGPKQEVQSYDGGSKMTKAQLGYKDVRSLSFTVSTAKDLGLPVSILMDSIYYTLTPNVHKPTA